jgi:cytidylate kinase
MSREVIAQCAAKYNLMEDDLYKTLMEAPSFWQRLSQKHRRYLIFIQCSLIEAAKQDNIIYHGYAGQLLLQDVRHALKLRLEAPFDTRVQAEMDEYGKDRSEAQEYIQRMDEQRNRWVRFLYGREWHDPSLYDLSVNLQTTSLEMVCAMVEDMLQAPEYQTTEESRRMLENLSLACEVKAALAADDRLWNQEIAVTASGSAITLQGSVRDAQIRDSIVELASQVKGVSYCNSSLTLLSEPTHGGTFGMR